MASLSLGSGLPLMTYFPSIPRWKYFQKRYALFAVLSICIIFLYFQNVTLERQVDPTTPVMEVEEDAASLGLNVDERIISLSYIWNFLKKPVIDAFKFNKEIWLNGTTTVHTVPLILSEHEGKTTNPSVNSSRIVSGTAKGKPTLSGYKTVVIYTTFWGGSWSDYLRNGRTDLAHHGCSVHQCLFSFDKDKASSADAVLFHGVDHNPNDVPKIRHRHQRYIWMIVEAPNLYQNMSAVKPPKTPGIFNWTATYHRKSEIQISYGALLPKEGGKLPHNLYPFDQKSPTYKMYTKALAQKMELIKEANGTLGLEDLLAKLRGGKSGISANVTRRSEGMSSANSTQVEESTDFYLNSSFYSRPKLVAWMVSHCNTVSGREVYINELKKYIPVDIYGRCSTLKCGRNHLDTFCYTDLLQPNYKFYLSFENMWCIDYMTEKVFLPLKYGLVPVVWGGTKFEDQLPPHSYVDATKYTPKELAAELKRIASSDVEYASYHLWRNYWRVVIPVPFCDLCRRLHTDTKEATIPDLGRWWNDVNNCTTRYPAQAYPRAKFSDVFKYLKSFGESLWKIRNIFKNNNVHND